MWVSTCSTVTTSLPLVANSGITSPTSSSTYEQAVADQLPHGAGDDGPADRLQDVLACRIDVAVRLEGDEPTVAGDGHLGRGEAPLSTSRRRAARNSPRRAGSTPTSSGATSSNDISVGMPLTIGELIGPNRSGRPRIPDVSPDEAEVMGARGFPE